MLEAASLTATSQPATLAGSACKSGRLGRCGWRARGKEENFFKKQKKTAAGPPPQEPRNSPRGKPPRTRKAIKGAHPPPSSREGTQPQLGRGGWPGKRAGGGQETEGGRWLRGHVARQKTPAGWLGPGCHSTREAGPRGAPPLSPRRLGGGCARGIKGSVGANSQKGRRLRGRMINRWGGGVITCELFGVLLPLLTRSSRRTRLPWASYKRGSAVLSGHAP